MLLLVLMGGILPPGGAGCAFTGSRRREPAGRGGR